MLGRWLFTFMIEWCMEIRRRYYTIAECVHKDEESKIQDAVTDIH